MSKYLLCGVSIGVLTCISLMPALSERFLALPGYWFVLTLGAVLTFRLAGLVFPQLSQRWPLLATETLDHLANQLQAPIGIALGLSAVATLQALTSPNHFGASASVALLSLVISLSFTGFAINLRHLASAWR